MQRNAGAGSLPEPEASALSPNVSCFLQSLTDRQLQVMLSGLHQMFTKDDITKLNTDIEKIVTTVSKKVIIPALCEGLNVDTRALFITSPGSSNRSLESVTREVANAIVKTIIDALDQKPDAHKLELPQSVMEKTELPALSVELNTKNLTWKDQPKLQKCEIHTIYQAKDLLSALGLSYLSKMRVIDFGDCLVLELGDDISSDPSRGEALQRAKPVHGVPSFMNLSNMAGKMETSVPGQTLRNVSSCEGSSSDTSLLSDLLVDHLMAYVQKVSSSSSGHSTPATALVNQRPSFLRNLSAKSLKKIQSEKTRTKAAQEVAKILFLTSDRFLESSLRSQRADTSRQDCGLERTPSECLDKAYNLVDSVIDRIFEGLHSRCGPLDCMESSIDVCEVLWYIACTTHYTTMRHLRDFCAMYQQKAPKFDPIVSPEDAICLPGAPTPQPYLHKLAVRAMDKHKRRERVSMATLLDTMMASLGLQSSGHLNSVEDISAAAKRVDGLCSTAATEEFAKMVRLMLTDRCCQKHSYFPFLQQSFASGFLSEFADQSVKRLLTTCIAPRAASTATENIPTLVMPFRACPESFEFSRLPSEVFDDTVDLFSDAIVNSVMGRVSKLSDYELDAELSNAEETPESDSHRSEKLRTSPPTIKSDRQHHACPAAWLVLRVLAQSKRSSSDLTKEASSSDPKGLIERILREVSASSSAAKLEEGLDGTFVELLQRFGEEGSLHKALDARDSTFDEALMTALRKHLGADASTAVPETMGVKNIHSKERKGIFFRLKMPKLCIFKNKSRKDNSGGHTDQPRKPSIFSKMPGTENTKQDALSKQWEPLGPDPFPEPTLFPLLVSWLHTVGSLRLIMEALRQEPDSGGRRPGLPPAKDNMVILVLVDFFFKAGKFMPLPKLSSAKEKVELLSQHMVRIHGTREQCMWKSFCQLMGGSLSLSSDFYPETNSQTDRVNKDITQTLRCLTSTNPSSWAEYLP
ncbi:hypothetical protein AOLI_G00195710 [Acnodon oligacanthus]